MCYQCIPSEKSDPTQPELLADLDPEMRSPSPGQTPINLVFPSIFNNNIKCFCIDVIKTL